MIDLGGYIEYLRHDKDTRYSDSTNAAIQDERLKIADDLERMLSNAAQGVEHGASDHGIEQSTKATFVPCGCGCGRSCCAHCGVDVGFVSTASSGLRGTREGV